VGLKATQWRELKVIYRSPGFTGEKVHIFIAAGLLSRASRQLKAAVAGTAAVLAPGLTSRVMGFPADTDTPATRLVARFFGLREVAMGALTLAVLRRDPSARRLMSWNAAVDGSDAVIAALALVVRRGIDRAALGTIALALPLCTAWLWLRTQAE